MIETVLVVVMGIIIVSLILKGYSVLGEHGDSPVEKSEPEQAEKQNEAKPCI